VPERLDGVFSDFADTAVAARVLHRLATDPEFAPCFTGDANRRGHGACRGSDD
jgi:glycerophosphoryl diester phosphodiesterase